MAPTFSVIVAAYNSESRIEATLGSVLAQSEADLELIVVDDGSTDSTAQRAERVAAGDRRVRLIRQENTGAVGARNHGIEAASGRCIGFLDDDDLWLPRYLEVVGRPLTGAEAAGIAYSDAWVVDAATGLAGRRTALGRYPRWVRSLDRRLAAGAAERALLRANFITTCAALVSRAAIERVGPLDAEIRGADDWDLWLRIAAAGFGLIRVDEPLAALRKRSNSVSSDTLLMARNSSAVLDRARRRLQDPAAERVARRHQRLIEAEIAAAEGGSAPRLELARLARRLGRKRLPWPPGGREWHRPEGELRATLEAAASAAVQPGRESRPEAD